MKRCPHKLTSGPRAGEVCGRRYTAGDGCELHRPPRPRRQRKPTPKENRAQYRKRRARIEQAGVPASWAGVV